MSSSLRYAGAGTGVVTVAVLLFWPFLDAVGRQGVLIAALVALPVQIGSYAFLERYRGQTRGFLTAWVGGTVLRLVVIGTAAFVAIRIDIDLAIPMLFALASFFFGLLLLEPLYFRGGRQQAG